MTDESDLPTADEIIAIHNKIEREYDLTYTGAAVASPWLELREILEEVEDYEGTFLRAAALLRDILTAHLFEDGNKRTSWAVTRLYLENHDAEPAVRDAEEAERVLKRVRRYDVEEIADWLADGEIDSERLE
jgi:death-on-curing protein